MKRCKADFVRMCLFLLATVPAYCQRGMIGVDAGQASDKFGGLSQVNGALINLNGEFTLIQPNKKEGGPSIDIGGEMRLPIDTTNHAKEFAVFGGPAWKAHNLSIGVNAQVRKIILPTANVDNQIIDRATMELFELPVVIKYTFGAAPNRAFVQVQGAPEFSPRWHQPSGSILPNPHLDHGYFVRGSVGYIFGKWYARATYETRYFSFTQDLGNPSGLYNWRSNQITGGVGFAF